MFRILLTSSSYYAIIWNIKTEKEVKSLIEKFMRMMETTAFRKIINYLFEEMQKKIRKDK